MQEVRWLGNALRLAALGFFLWMVRDLLVPVALAALLALLLAPLQDRLGARLGRHAGWAPFFVTLSTVVLVVLPAVLMMTRAIASFEDLMRRDWSDTMQMFQAFIQRTLGRLPFAPGRIESSIESLVRTIGGALASAAGGVARALPGQILDLFLFVVALYYFLRDGAALTRWLERLAPFPAKETQELFASIRETVNGTMVSLLATSAVQGGLTMVALYIFGVPGAFLFGLLAMLLAFVPMVGTTPVTVGAVIYLLASGRGGAAIGMAIAAVAIGVSDNIVRPWVQSAHSKRMHPLVVLLGIFGGLQLLGATGVFLGPVIAAIAIWTIDRYAAGHLRPSSPPPSA